MPTQAGPAEATIPFSQALRAATESVHADAEQAPFLAELLAGRLGRDGLARLAAQHLHLYRGLEALVDAHAAHPEVAPFVAEELRRVPALEADLAALLGPGWARRVPVLEATQAYVERLEAVGRSAWAGGVVAHHYTRYLGDLSGGIFIGRRLDEVLGLEDGGGTAFYRFPGIPDPAAFKTRYRARLDAAPWDEAERQRVVDEVLLAYVHNAAIFDELGR
jgi:heme oxygenase